MVIKDYIYNSPRDSSYRRKRKGIFADSDKRGNYSKRDFLGGVKKKK